MKNVTCCFIGHRTINETDELRANLYEIIENMIVKENVGTFLFGSRSEFNYLCLDIVSEYKEKYPHIKRIYVRAEYPYIRKDYRDYLLKNYEYTYYPEKLHGSGKGAYIERNFEMIRNSEFCVIYCNKNNAPVSRKSGTEIALKYAIKKKKRIIYC